MADNTVLNSGSGGDTYRSKDRAGVKTQVVALDINPAGSETLMNGVMPVNDNGGSLTVDGTVGVSGTVTVDSELTTADLDTGAGTDTRAVVGVALAASGGAQLLPGDSTNGAKVQVAAALPAGTNNIGDVDVLTLPSLPAGTNNIGDVDVLTLPSLPAGSNAIGKLAANSGVNIGTVDVASLSAAQLPSSLTGAGNLKVAIQESTLPSVVTRSNVVAASDGAQTNAALSPAVGSGNKLVLTRLTVKCSNANTVNVAVRVGFGTATIPSPTLAGTSGIVFDDGGMAPGSGVTMGDGSGALAIGALDEELRITCDSPTSGDIRVSYSYYLM